MEELKPFGRYDIIATLGRGGMADVFLARARGIEGFQRLVVIKRTRPDVADDESYRRMFLYEARLSARLHHPNVVQVFEVGEQEGGHYLAMEYLDGQPLSRVVGSLRQVDKKLEAPFGARVISEVLAGLHYAHELTDYDGKPLGIIHRDVTPQNVFVTYAGEVKLVDFGIAKANDAIETTEAGVVKGKTAYLAPEQVAVTKLDRRVDVFAAGVILWEMLSGKRLFLGTSSLHTISKLLTEPIPHLTEVVPDAPPELDAICARALSRDPEGRFQTAGEMRDAVEEWLERSPVRPPRRDEIGRRVSELFASEREKIDARILAAMGTSNPGPPASLRSSLSSVPDAHTPAPPSEPSPTRRDGSITTRSATIVATPAQSFEPPAHSGRETASPAPRRPWIATALIALGGLAVVGAVAIVTRGRPASEATVAAVPAAPTQAAPAVQATPLLHFCGSNTVGAELAPALAAAYVERKGATSVHRGAGKAADSVIVSFTLNGAPRSIVIDAAGSATAFTRLAEKACEIGMASRAIHDDEAQKLASLGFGDMRSPSSEHVIALDGIAVIVNHENALKTLDASQLARVFGGEVTDWSAVGGTPGPIQLYGRDNQSGTTDTFRHLVLGGRDLAASAKRFSSSDALSDAVAADRGGIGFVGLAYMRSAKAIAVGDVGAEARLPSSFTVSTEGYLLSRRLYLYTSAHPTDPATLDFVGFVLSPDGQKVVREQGFVDLSVSVQATQPCTGCSLWYSGLVKNARRMSVDFRFRQGSDELDSRAIRDLDRLVLYLRGQSNTRVLLLGFSDAEGDAAQNVRLSRDRGRRVATELHARGVEATVEGLGPEMPIATNGTPAGRERNRRVEVWLTGDSP